MDAAKTLKLVPSIWQRPARKKKLEGLNFYKDKKT